MKKRVKAKEHENLSETNIRKVISLLEAEDEKKRITKKAACEILNISYNTTRLDTIIENYKQDRAIRKELRAKRRGKPPTNDEISTIITMLFGGVSPIWSVLGHDHRLRPAWQYDFRFVQLTRLTSIGFA